MDRIGKFQLRKKLGKGASGTVYLALDTFTGNEVALKVLDPELIGGSGIGQANIAQFMNEASLAGKLSHPHIAAILEASVSGAAGYIAIEYVPGGDLSQFIVPGQLLQPESAIEVAFKCCGALDYAFRQGIVHRDLKPANILVVEGSNIKVADFGAAYLSKRSGQQIAAIGSPLYMSPEQVAGIPLDYRSDMFALGVVLYQLFTGRPPYVAANLAELFARIRDAEPPAPSSLRPEIGRELDAILLRMMAKQPGDRFPSWAELALEIARIGRLSVYQSSVPDSEKFFALKKSRVLGQLDDADLWELAHIGRWSRLPSRSVIVREGESGRSVFFIGSGQVKVTKQGRLLNLLDAGECIGEMCYVKEGEIPRQATVESMQDVLLVEFDREAIDHVGLKCRHQFALALMHSLVDRLVLADARIIRAG